MVMDDETARLLDQLPEEAAVRLRDVIREMARECRAWHVEREWGTMSFELTWAGGHFKSYKTIEHKTRIYKQ